MNDHGNRTTVVPWLPETSSEIAEQQYAVKLMDLRKGIEDEANRLATA
jgi:hypothetical protein